MDKSTLQSLLDSNGWVPADQIADFDFEIPYVLYYKKVTPKAHIYLTCVVYGNILVETIVEHFHGKKHTRCPKHLLQNWINCRMDNAAGRERKEKARQVLIKGGYLADKFSIERNDDVVISVIRA